jgi:hypothetical protein
MRAKAFSLQVVDPMVDFLSKTEEKCAQEPLFNDAPKRFTPSGPKCSVRSLLLDDEDELDDLFTSMRPRSLDWDQNLNISDEEELT